MCWLQTGHVQVVQAIHQRAELGGDLGAIHTAGLEGIHIDLEDLLGDRLPAVDEIRGRSALLREELQVLLQTALAPQIHPQEVAARRVAAHLAHLVVDLGTHLPALQGLRSVLDDHALVAHRAAHAGNHADDARNVHRHIARGTAMQARILQIVLLTIDHANHIQHR